MSKNPIPQGKYKPAVRYGNLIFTAGMTPRKDGVLLMSGKISPDRPLDDYRDAVIQAASNALTAAQNTLGEGEKIVQILSLTVYLNATEDYTTHAKVGDIVYNWLYEQLGDAGIGARAAIALATQLREAGIRAQIHGEQKKFKQKISYADKLHIPYVIFLGEDEISSGVAAVKDLATGEQVKLPPAEAIAHIQAGLDKLNQGAPILDRGE